MLRIWFNRAYATTCHTIAMIRDNPDRRPVSIIATHTDPDSPVPAAADVAEPEPDSGADYVGWALEFARRNAVDVLVPRAHAAELASAQAEFTRAGTALMCAGPETIARFADKVSGYRAALRLGLPVPPHRVVRDPDELRHAYRALAPLSRWVCVKPVRGTGGAGYRRLTDQPFAFADFAGQPRAQADLDTYCRAMTAAYTDGADVQDLLVMPYLDGPEVSVDAVATPAGEPLCTVGRHHGPDTRRRVLVDDADARAVAAALISEHAVGYLSNTQVRYWRGPGDETPRPYLLELNTRAAGGLFQTRLAGVNLPWAAVRLALGEDVAPLRPVYGAAYTVVNDLVPLPAREPAR